MGVMTDEAPWLPYDDAQQLWRRWLRLNALLPAALHRELQADADLSLPDFDVLVQLTDSPEGRVRVTELARGLQWERSRVSHHVTRMGRRGLVAREECHDDGRGAFVVITEDGRAAIERAAPGHVATVRRLVFGALSPQETAVMATVIDKVLTRLEGDTAAVSA
jgi:DNA-binding MarR family transcriptional regulator